MDTVRDASGSGPVADGSGDRVAYLDSAHWKRLGAAQSLPEFCSAWAALQCALVPDAVCAMVALDELADMPLPQAWPDGIRGTGFRRALDLAREAHKGIALPIGDGDTVRGRAPACHLAFPLLLDDRLAGAVAIEIESSSESAIRGAMRQLQWGVAWLRERLLCLREKESSTRLARVAGVLDMLAVCAEQPRFAAACQALATEAAMRFSCDRVSVGLMRGQRARIVAISHSARFGKQMNLVRLLGDAMDEATDQQAVIVHPAPADEPISTRAHAELAQRHGAGTVLTCPIFLKDRFIGALTFERPAHQPFDADTIAAADAVAGAVAPVLEDKRRNDRWLIESAVSWVGTEIGRLLGPGHAARKLSIAAAVACIAIFYVWTDLYRVTADAAVEGRVQRAMVAPFNGFIRDAPARAGDTVEAGQVVAALDDRELALERLRLVTERQRRVIEYDRALSERNRTETRSLSSLIEQADAQIRLVDEQLARTRIVAPFAGLIVAGDLTQAIGAAVQRGQTLFEIAPLDDYRVVLLVDESQIAELTEGGQGALVVASLPTETFPIAVSRITPVSTAKDGRNVFRVEATLREAAPGLRPGMKGLAKLDVDRRRVVWIWTRAFQSWLRIALWRWFA